MIPDTPKTLEDWDPEDREIWVEESGKQIARRNLVISVFTLFLAFAVWSVWSFVVIYMHEVGFEYSDSQLFMLTALPPLMGAFGRILYSFAVPIFGGRRFNTFATASLLIPAVGLGLAVQNPDTPYWVMVILSMLAGLGGANFSSSMDHIAYLFPNGEEGTALGINAGIGNMGVSAAQLVVPVVITVGIFGAIGGNGLPNPNGDPLWLQNAGFVWVPLILLGTVGSWYGLNDIASVNAKFSEQLTILRRKHNWLMCYLYVGTFGSFLGYATAFPLLTTIQFPEQNVAAVAFWGPLIGALTRPPGGWLADKFGGARVTMWVFMTMTVGSALVVYFMIEGIFWGFFAAFIVLFLASGVGNGSTFKMIPVVFRQRHVDRVGPSPIPAKRKKALKQAELEAGSVLGFAGGIGAFGGFLIPQAFSSSIELTGATISAMSAFLFFYLTCLVITWFYYYRENAEAPC